MELTKISPNTGNSSNTLSTQVNSTNTFQIKLLCDKSTCESCTYDVTNLEIDSCQDLLSRWYVLLTKAPVIPAPEQNTEIVLIEVIFLLSVVVVANKDILIPLFYLE